jgi:uncharacterized protein YndB with AHSA1/START domain
MVLTKVKQQTTYKSDYIVISQTLKLTNMNTQSSTITVEVTVEKPIASVWQVWASPADIMQWNIPFVDWHCPSVENDLQSGGRFIFRMEAKDGSDGFDHSGKYDVVILHQLIKYTGDDGRKSEIKFVSHGDTTTVSETFEPEQTNPIDMQRDFCFSVLNSFKKHAESKTD